MAIRAVGRERPWLFEAFPELKGNLPWMPLVEAPTPVERLDGISRRMGAEVWMKRDDKTSRLYGGNKPRKLEFLLADAKAGGRKRLVTGGGLGTNHGLATTIFGRNAGFDVALMLSEQPVTDHVRSNLLLLHTLGAEMHLAGPSLAAVPKDQLGDEDYYIPLGGSNPVGELGFIDAAFELALQMERGETPPPAKIFVAAGTAGTMAGLILGLRLAGIDIDVVGVRVTPASIANADVVTDLVKDCVELLSSRGAGLPDVDIGGGDILMDGDHFGSGYGCATEASDEAARIMADEEGIELDGAYTSKAFAALLDYVRGGSADGPVLFWNTFNSMDLSGRIHGADYRGLPEEFQRFYQGGAAD